MNIYKVDTEITLFKTYLVEATSEEEAHQAVRNDGWMEATDKIQLVDKSEGEEERILYAEFDYSVEEPCDFENEMIDQGYRIPNNAC